MIKDTELNKFIQLFEAWDDTIYYLKHPQDLDDDNILNYIRMEYYIPNSKSDQFDIRERFKPIYSYKSIEALKKEIKDNLYEIKEQDRENYIRSILFEFTPIYVFFSPTSIYENVINLSIPVARIVPGKNIVNFIWYEYSLNNKTYKNQCAQYIIKCCSLLWSFIEELDIICMGFEIDIEYIQNKYEIRVRKERNYFSLKVDGGYSSEYVREIEGRFKKIEENLSLQRVKNKKEVIQSFKDIFLCEDRYNEAINWLEENGFFSKGIFTGKSKDTALLFLTLQLFGYSKGGLSIDEREVISSLIGKKYSRSSFNNFDKKDYTIQELENPNVNIFSSLPKFNEK